MRATCFVIVTLAASLAQAAPCQWQDAQGWPAMKRKSGIVYFERTWVCPPDASGTLEVKLYSVRGKKKTELESEKSEVKPKGEWERTKKVSARVFPYGSSPMCEEKPKGKVKRVMRVFDHELHAAFPVKIRAEVTGTGDMAPLAMNEELDGYCRLCNRTGSRLSLKWGRAGASAVDKKATYLMSVDRATYACLKPGATLEIRYFLGDDKKEISRLIRPAFVEKGIEHKLKKNGDKLVFEGKPPIARLCRAKKKYVGYELSGKGELRHLDSNRYILPLRCN